MSSNPDQRTPNVAAPLMIPFEIGLLKSNVGSHADESKNEPFWHKTLIGLSDGNVENFDRCGEKYVAVSPLKGLEKSPNCVK